MLLFPAANHPLLIGLIILALTFFTAVALGLVRRRTWLSYILVLVLLGGLLVIFIYISLLAPNENQTSYNTKILLVRVGAFLSLALGVSSRVLEFPSGTNAFTKFNPLQTEGLDWLYWFYSQQLGGITLFLALYLFLTLIVVVTISKTDSSSLRAQ